MGKKGLLIVLPIIIVVGVYFAYRGAKPRKHGESKYRYTAYGIADDGTIYRFGVEGPGLEWPVKYDGKELKALYGCADCKRVFPAEPGVMTTRCPNCGSQNVGAYDPELHGPVDAVTISIDQSP
jgi:hypothetical protein